MTGRNTIGQSTMTENAKSPDLQRVESFWDENVCGAHFIDADFREQDQFSEEFYASYRDFRYEKEHHLNTLIDWKSARDKDVLEIGLGLGADASRWASNARTFTGIDLTEEAVNATRRHLELLGLCGNICQGNAEDLPFDDGSFDLISSHGVLHHTEDISAALREVFRVLRPGGQFIVMLYAKHSFNYWVRIQGLFRVTYLLNALKSHLGLSVREPWASHLANAETDPEYFTWAGWPHHCTDGPDCKIANIYSWKEIDSLLSQAGFEVNRREKAHFPARLPQAVERSIARRIGFYQFAWSTKPQS